MPISRTGPKTKWTFGVSAKVSAPIEPDWPRIEAECNVTFKPATRTEIEDLLKWFRDWLDVAEGAWHDTEVREAAQDIEKAIENFRTKVIDGEVFPKHPDGRHAAQLQFASRARQAVGYLAMLSAIYLRGDAGPDAAEHRPESATDSRMEKLDRQAVEHQRMLGFRPADFQVALDNTARALRALHGSITPLLELGTQSPKRNHPEIVLYRAFLLNLSTILERHKFPAAASNSYPERNFFLRLLKALGLEKKLDGATAQRVLRYMSDEVT